MTGLDAGSLAREGGAHIAYLKRAGRTPGIVWLGGFKSEMTATKATALDAWAAREAPRIRALRLFRARRVDQEIFAKARSRAGATTRWPSSTR